MNFARFYALLHRLPVRDAEVKERLVLRFTRGRTTSLREMTAAEYGALCDALDRSLRDPREAEREAEREALRKRRSETLRLMQRLGIDTTEWARIDAFCRDRRIAGKVFAALGRTELEALSVKLRSIARRGGLRPPGEGPAERAGSGAAVTDAVTGRTGRTAVKSGAAGTGAAAGRTGTTGANGTTSATGTTGVKSAAAGRTAVKSAAAGTGAATGRTGTDGTTEVNGADAMTGRTGVKSAAAGRTGTTGANGTTSATGTTGVKSAADAAGSDTGSGASKMPGPRTPQALRPGASARPEAQIVCLPWDRPPS